MRAYDQPDWRLYDPYLSFDKAVDTDMQLGARSEPLSMELALSRALAVGWSSGLFTPWTPRIMLIHCGELVHAPADHPEENSPGLEPGAAVMAGLGVPVTLAA